MANDIAAQLPDVYTETIATSKAAGIEYWMLVVAGAMSDVADLISRKATGTARPLAECTIVPQRTVADNVVLTGTWDTHGSAARHCLVLMRHPVAGPETLALTTYGWPLQQAVTSDGLVYAIANLVARTAARGVPYIAVLPHLATCATVESGLMELARLRHCSGRFYAIANQFEYRAVEIVPGHGPFVSEDWGPHTNHYLNDAAQQWEGRPEDLQDSARRLANAVTDGSSVARDIPALLRWFQDHRLTQDGSGDYDVTAAIFALVPRARSLYVMISGSVDGFVTSPVHVYKLSQA
jgi:hypothetical protein